MANRSYLYSAKLEPTSDLNIDEQRIVGISEWNYDIPLAFKLLLSGNPRKCPSSIWDDAGEIALVGEYDEGTSRLMAFLDQISHPGLLSLKTDARAFLTAERNRNRFFVLECGEIFEMEDGELDEQTDHLLRSIQNISSEEKSILEKLNAPASAASKPPGFFAKLFGARARIAETRDPAGLVIDSLGLGNWSNVLYYDLRRKE